VFGAGVVLIPRIPLINLILLSQVANGVLLPFVLFYMLKLVNREDIMGRHKNSRFTNAVAITTSVAMMVLTVAMIWTTLTGS
jgi:Mn2+/Fe2+ NRAMP family transporter